MRSFYSQDFVFTGGMRINNLPTIQKMCAPITRLVWKIRVWKVGLDWLKGLFERKHFWNGIHHDSVDVVCFGLAEQMPGHRFDAWPVHLTLHKPRRKPRHHIKIKMHAFRVNFQICTSLVFSQVSFVEAEEEGVANLILIQANSLKAVVAHVMFCDALLSSIGFQRLAKAVFSVFFRRY